MTEMQLFTPQEVKKYNLDKNDINYNIDDVCTNILSISGGHDRSYKSMQKSKSVKLDSVIRILRRGRYPNMQTIHISLTDRHEVGKAFWHAHSVSVWSIKNNKIYAEVFANCYTTTFKRCIVSDIENKVYAKNIDYITSSLAEIFSIYTYVPDGYIVYD
jgi:hypothetical protein